MSESKMSCSFVSNESICPPFKEESTIIPLSSCTSDIRDHLRSTLGVSVKRSAEDESVLSEIDLILNRSGQFRADHSKMTVCPKHRRELTIDWPGRKRNTCTYPSHKGPRKQLKTLRRVNSSMSMEIYNRFDQLVPIGSGKYDMTTNKC